MPPFNAASKLSRELDYASVIFQHLVNLSRTSTTMYDAATKSNTLGVLNYKGGIEFLSALAFPWHDVEYYAKLKAMPTSRHVFNASDPQAVNDLHKKAELIIWLIYKSGIIEQYTKPLDQYERDQQEVDEYINVED